MRVFLNRAVQLAFVIALSAPCLATAGDAPSDDIKKAAREAFKSKIKNHKIDDWLQRQGFETQADLDNAELGEAFQFSLIDTNKLLDDSAPQDIQSLVMAPFNMWRFPVLSGGKVKSHFLRVDLVGQGIRATDVIIPWLAKEMNGIMSTWPASSGYRYRFIQVSQADAALMEISKGGEVIGVISLSTLAKRSGRKEGEFKLGDLRNPQEVLAELRTLVKQENDWYRPPSEAVMIAAREALVHQVKKRVIDRLSDYGFESQADIDNSELGEGFREFGMSDKILLDETAVQDFQSTTVPYSRWYFPILANGKTKSIIEIKFDHGIWRYSGIGPSALAKEVSGLKAKWPASSGYQFRYITTFNSISRYFELSKGGNVLGLIPLFEVSRKAGRIIGEFEPGDLRDPQEILKALRIQLKQNIERANKGED